MDLHKQVYGYTLPETNSSPLKMGCSWNTSRLPLGARPIFRGEIAVSFRGPAPFTIALLFTIGFTADPASKYAPARKNSKKPKDAMSTMNNGESQQKDLKTHIADPWDEREICGSMNG